MAAHEMSWRKLQTLLFITIITGVPVLTQATVVVGVPGRVSEMAQMAV